MVFRRDDSEQLTWDLEEVLDKFFGTKDAMEVILLPLQLLWQGSAKLLTLIDRQRVAFADAETVLRKQRIAYHNTMSHCQSSCIRTVAEKLPPVRQVEHGHTWQRTID